MQFQVLGPVRVIDQSGVDILVSRPSQRAMLAVLLLHANRPVCTMDLTRMLTRSRGLSERMSGRSASTLSLPNAFRRKQPDTDSESI